MKLLHRLGRAALGIPFIILGYEAAKEPGPRVAAAESLGLPDPRAAVQFNGAAMVAGGAALTMGVLPRTAALGLVVSLIPTTVAGHAFWNITDPTERTQQRIQVLKNLGLAGALLTYATRA